MSDYHTSVLLSEAVDALSVFGGGRYIDGTFGGGGHTREILRRGGTVLAFDVDENAIKRGQSEFAEDIRIGSLALKNRNFSEISEAVSKVGWKENTIDGILYDLGVSTFQIKESNKGFSFNDDAHLDMRMDTNLNVTAEDLIRGLSEKELGQLLNTYGEDPQSYKYARAIKKHVKEGKEVTGKEIAEVVQRASKYKDSRLHPATRVFQALRIAVNSELDNFKVSVGRATPLLKPQGRLVIITFHSLEDAIAKELQTSPALKALSEAVIIPSEQEIRNNPSSRSAKMRIYEKITNNNKN